MKYCGWMKNIEEELDHKSFPEITTRYNSNQRKHKYELEEPYKQLNRIFIDEVIIQSNYRLYNNNGS